MEKILIHIPKTGGSAIARNIPLNRKIVQPIRSHLDGKYHSLLEKHAKENGHSAQVGHCRWMDLDVSHRNKYPAVAIVRNPWSKLVSQFLFAQLIYADAVKAGKPVLKEPTNDFNIFLSQYNTCVNIPYNWHRTTSNFQEQLTYVTDVNGKLKCDILRFEKYNTDTMAYFKLNTPLAPRNVSNGKKTQDGVTGKKDYMDFYTSKSRETVAEWYKNDIKFFGFSFDSAATLNIWNKE